LAGTPQLAEFTAPDIVNQIRSLMERGAENPFAAALARMFLQTGAGS